MHRPIRACALLCALVTAAARGDGHDALVEALYRESGLAEQVVGIPQQIVEGFSEGFTGGAGEPGLTPEARELLGEEVRTAFAAGPMGESIRADIARELSGEDITRVLEWLRSPLGQRLTRLEADASTGEAYLEMIEFGRGLQRNPPEERRLVRIDQLLRAMNGVEASVSMALSVQMAVVTGLVAATPGSGPEDLSAAITDLERSRGEIARFMEAQTLVAMLFTYRDATDAELRRYVEFARTDHGRRYHEVTFRAFERAMVLASQRLGSGIVRSLHGGAA